MLTDLRCAATALMVIGMVISGCGNEGKPDPQPDPDPDPELAEFVELVKQAQQRTQADPRRMLAILRQLYYGAPWSVSSANALWRLIIPCSPELEDPHGELGDELFDALGSRAEIAGIDMGHLFAGLEAMVCPSPKVIVVTMSNEDFATWGGDLGAAVAAHSACLAMGEDAATIADCGSKPGGQPLAFYLQHHAPPQDLEGDLDPFAVRAVLMEVPCAESRLQPLTLDRPLSEVLGDYYLRPSSVLGQARRQRDRCVLELLGATLDGDEIANHDVLVEQLGDQVASFAETYYATIRNAVPDAAEKATLHLDALTAVEELLKTLQP